MAAPTASEVVDAYGSFKHRLGLTVTTREHDALYHAVSELLEGDEIDAYAPVEMAGDPWILLVTQKAGGILLRADEAAAEARILARLQGSYSERWVCEEFGFSTTMTFEDHRLPGESLSLEIPSPPNPRSFPTPGGQQQTEMLRKIRQRLRGWARDADSD